MPRTEAGKALLRDMLDPDEPLFPMDPGASIDAIEAEAVAAERARIRAAVERLDTHEFIDSYGDEDGMCPNCVTPWKCNGPHEPPAAQGTTWLAVDRAAVLAIIRGEQP